MEHIHQYKLKEIEHFISGECIEKRFCMCGTTLDIQLNKNGLPTTIIRKDKMTMEAALDMGLADYTKIGELMRVRKKRVYLKTQEELETLKVNGWI